MEQHETEANNERIEIADAPAIDGLAFRRLRGAVDFPALRAVREGSLARDALDADSARDPLPTLADYAQRFSQPNDPNALVVEVGGTVIGYILLNWWVEEDGTAVYLHLGYLLPTWRGKGIGFAMLRWAQARCRELAEEHQASGNVVFATNVCVTEREATRLIVRAGYTVARRISDMAQTLTTPAALEAVALPEGVEIRPVTPDQYRAIYAMFADAWEGMWGSESASEEGYREFLEEHVEIPDFDPDLWRVAWAGEEAAGCVICRVRESVARAGGRFGVVEQVATRKAWQRRGIARALLVEALRTLATHGVADARISTDAGNSSGARGLYERVGFRMTTEHRLYRKPME